MSLVGVIINPASGKDIRRLACLGSVFDNNEKANIVLRLLSALESVGVEEVRLMPDSGRVAARVLDETETKLGLRLLDMETTGRQEDTIEAARLLAEAGAGCIVVLGGDGASRAAAKACGEAPLLPISTGTNNVFPWLVEGTTAGLAAGLVARERYSKEETCFKAPKLDVFRNGDPIDLALVDAAATEEDFIGARALCDVSTIREIVLTRAEPDLIGLAAVGGALHPLPKGGGRGLFIRLGPGPESVLAAIAPGLVVPVPIREFREVEPGEPVEMPAGPLVLALDGEREVYVGPEDRLTVKLDLKGPYVVDVGRVLDLAGRDRLFVFSQDESAGNR